MIKASIKHITATGIVLPFGFFATFTAVTAAAVLIAVFTAVAAFAAGAEETVFLREEVVVRDAVVRFFAPVSPEVLPPRIAEKGLFAVTRLVVLEVDFPVLFSITAPCESLLLYYIMQTAVKSS